VKSFYDLVLSPIGWWTEKEYYSWVAELKIYKQQQKQT
jgi:hypothetical protein